MASAFALDGWHSNCNGHAAPALNSTQLHSLSIHTVTIHKLKKSLKYKGLQYILRHNTDQQGLICALDFMHARLADAFSRACS
jgi:hypothetical protein